MADLFDRFVGAAGVITAHTADSGDTWGPSGTSHAIDGSGSLYQTYPMAGANDYGTASTWTPPGTDYAASVVFGAGFRQSAVTGCGPIVRATITDINNFKYYVASAVAGTPDLLTVACLDCVSGSVTVPYVATQDFPTQIAAGDTLTLTVSGTSTPVLTVYHNGTQIWTGTDSGGSIVAAGSAGVHIGTQSTVGSTDMVRTVWAGAVGGPTTTITPATPSVVVNATQSFTAATAHTNETFTWSATHGSISGSLATETYTAPASGSTDTVTWVSVDLPLDTASATVTLTGSGLTPGTTTAVAASNTSATITGTAVSSGVSPYSYAVRRSTSSGGTYATVHTQSGVASGPPAPYTDTGLTPNTIYWYKHEVTDSASTVVDSTPVSVLVRVVSTYYVAAAGSDSNDGLSTGTPWQTAGKITSYGAVPGDTFLLNGGDTITGTLTLSGLSGTGSTRTTVGTYGAGTPILGPGTAMGLRIVDSSFVRFSGINITGPGVNSAGSMVTGTARMPLVEILNDQGSSTGMGTIQILNSTISGGYAGIWAHSTASSAPGPINNLEIGNCSLHGFLYPAIWISGSEATSGQTTGAPFYLSKGPLHQTLNIHDCTIYNCYGGVQTGYTTGFAGQTLTSGDLASGCPDSTDDDRPINGSGVVIGNVDGGFVQFSEIHHHGLNAANSTGFGGPGNLWAYESTGLTYHVVESHHGQTASTDGVGIDFDGGCTDCIAEYCYAHDNAGSGFFVGPITGESVGNSGNTFRYCISENDGASYLSEASFETFGSVANCLVHNCVFYNKASGGKAAMLLQGGSGNYAFSNIMISDGSPLLFSTTTGAWDLQNNLYHNYSGSFSISWNGTSYGSLAAYQTASSQDLGSLAVDPLLTNPGNGGTISNLRGLSTALAAYLLGSTSPAIDVAYTLPIAVLVGPRDFSGNPSLSGSAYDIGACEYTTVALPGGTAVFNPLGSSFIRGV